MLKAGNYLRNHVQQLLGRETKKGSEKELNKA
jgi:hypothetical protein